VPEDPTATAARIRAGASLDLYTAAAFRDEARAAIASCPAALIIDLGDTRFMDAMGLGVIVGAFPRAHDIPFSVLCDNELVRKVFRIAGLEQVLGVHGSGDGLTPQPSTSPP
jgi:anti-anti-sigma factor